MAEQPKILVVDDEEVVLLSVRRALRKENYTIHTVNAATDALELLQKDRFDVVITDLMMPGMDGMQLLELVKTQYSDLRVVMITGFATMTTAMKAIRQGAFDFIAKPFTRDELGSAVARAVKAGPADLSSDEEVKQPQGLASPGNLFTLRDITWAKIEPDGKVLVGMERKFIESIGEVLTIVVPEIGEHVAQGQPCTKVTSGDARVHTVWSPLSGRITKVNSALESNPQLVAEDPRGEGWLLKLDPTGLEFEVENLSQEK